MTSSLFHLEDLCITYTTHSDVEVVASLIGAVPLTVDYRLAPEAMAQSTATIVRWGDGILLSHPYFGYECARQEVLSALSNGGRVAVCVAWGLGCLPWSKSGGDMVPWFRAAAEMAYVAYAVDGRLEAGSTRVNSTGPIRSCAVAGIPAWSTTTCTSWTSARSRSTG